MEYYFYNTDADSLIEPPRPRFHLLINGSFAAVGGSRQTYGAKLGLLKPGDILLMYENRVGVVAIGSVIQSWDGIGYSEPLYYSLSEAAKLTGGTDEYRIGVDWFLDLRNRPVSHKSLRDRVFRPRGTLTRIVERRPEAEELVRELHEEAYPVPGEEDPLRTYREGAIRQVIVNAFERNHEAVTKCKEHWGTSCAVCEIDFRETYGDEFIGFIHVHHLRPLSKIRAEYEVDPIRDLRPVCPNCHAVIHHGGKHRTIKEVKNLLDRASRRLTIAASASSDAIRGRNRETN